MTILNRHPLPAFAGVLFILGSAWPSTSPAALIGTVPLSPGTTEPPGLVAPGTAPGVLLASLVSPYSYSTTAGTTSGTVATAVFRESGGTLDFYYQINNSASSATGIARQSDTSFSGFTTAVGYRTDGGTLPNGIFVNGAVAPQTADRASPSTVGFNFASPLLTEIEPGQSSNVMVISTNAINFTAGNTTIMDGGAQILGAFQPAVAVPEPGSIALGGICGMLLLARRRRV